MKARYLSFLILLGLTGFSTLAFSFENHVESKADSVPTQYEIQFLGMVEELVVRLGKKTHRYNILPKSQSVFTAATAADTGLEQLVKPLLNQDLTYSDMGVWSHARELGFDTGTKYAAVRKTPFPMFEVSLNDLRNFAPGKEANRLLSYTHQLMFPVEVGAQVKSSVTVRFVPDAPGKAKQHQKKTGWRLTRWGLPSLIHRLTTEHDRLKLQKPGFLVSIPSLNRYFLGYEEKTTVNLVPLFKRDHLTVGESYPAQDVFEWLSGEAKSVDGSPR